MVNGVLEGLTVLEITGGVASAYCSHTGYGYRMVNGTASGITGSHRQRISRWTSARLPSDAMNRLQEAGVPAGIVYATPDIPDDPHIKSVGTFEWTAGVHRESVLFPRGCILFKWPASGRGLPCTQTRGQSDYRGFTHPQDGLIITPPCRRPLRFARNRNGESRR